MEREACVCDHGFERSDLRAEIILLIIIIRSINLSINLLPPKSGDINARGGSMSSSYVVKYTMNDDSPISIGLLLNKNEITHPRKNKNHLHKQIGSLRL